MALGLQLGPLGESAVHLCVDMQGLFTAGSPWAVPWIERVIPVIVRLAERQAAHTIFTRFVPPERAEDARGAWRRYYQRWNQMTRGQVDPERIELVPELQRFAPPGRLLDKAVYSPWVEGGLDRMLAGSGKDTLVITGGETDVCVLATVLGAMDRGYRTVLVEDALCGSADQTHDALMQLYRSRFSEQLETAPLDEVLAAWRS